jgi:hypothetical protein
MGLTVVMGLVWSSFLCVGTGVAAPQVYTLHIDSQPLDSALQEFARQTGLQIFFFSRITDGQHSATLSGRYTLDAAMTRLLSDANLKYRLINPKTIEILQR